MSHACTDVPASETAERAAAFAERLRERMAVAPLSFPLSAFDSRGALDVPGFRAHVRRQLAASPGALFPCCGTGEFFSLAEDEYELLLSAAVEEAAGAVPVIAGIGHSWAQASRFAAIAERVGADGVLLLPPYLAEGARPGLVAYVREVAARTALPVIVYQRAQLRLGREDVADLAGVANVVGLKDGVGDLDQVQRLTLAAPARWLFFNGVATAEVQARAYRSVGVPAYSSAVHAFAPEIAHAFFTALRTEDHARVDRLLREFYVPLVELRDRAPGYQVALVKAAARLRGAEVGPVRAPLTEPTAEHLRALRALLDRGLDLVDAGR